MQGNSASDGGHLSPGRTASACRDQSTVPERNRYWDGCRRRAALRLMGAICTHQRYAVRMPKVIQIRDVPDDVRDALAQAADAEGLSLTRYVRRELEHLARRSQRVRDNAAIVRRTQEQVGARIDRGLILSELHDGRGD